ncbi:MAG: hypothetical protein JNJ83_05840 [Verrucomicrobiaceae bacterium]|nr:hypothetical protein [Verrucomicrobiaceae bacterium]
MSNVTRFRLFLVGLFVLAALATVGVQMRNGFYTRELGSDPDEPAHAVTALMVRDYLASSLGTNPAAFATQYYQHFPKVALGHYPPVFYGLAGFWLLPSPSVKALGVLQALLTALLVVSAAGLMARRMPWWLAGLLALGWSFMPLMQKQSSMVMADSLLAVVCLWSLIAWQKFVRSGTAASSVAFGCLAALAILTKGSAWLLGAVPPVYILLSRAWELLKNWRLWLAPLPVALLAVPWQLFSSKITARGMTSDTSAEHLGKAVTFYLEALPRSLTWPVALVLVIALGAILVRWHRSSEEREDDHSSAALVLATLLVVFLVPAGVTTRYLLPMFYPALILVSCLLWRWQPWSVLIVALASIASVDLPEPQQVDGYSEALGHIHRVSRTDGDLRILVVSDARGEGSVVAEVAFNKTSASDFSSTVYRASKELAEQDWLGRNYKAKATDLAALSTLLNQREVDWILVDYSVQDDRRAPYFGLVEKVLESSAWAHSADLPAIRTPGGQGRLALYQSRNL